MAGYCCHCGDILKSQKGQRASLVRRLRGSEETCAKACKLLFGPIPREIQNVCVTFLCIKCYSALGQLRRAHEKWNALAAGYNSVFKGMKIVTDDPPDSPAHSPSPTRRKKTRKRKPLQTTSFRRKLSRYASKGDYDQLMSTLYKKGSHVDRANFRNRMKYLIRKEVYGMKNSIGQDGSNPLEEPFVWKTFLKRAKHSCPLLYSVVTAALTSAQSERTMKTAKGFSLEPIQGAVLSTIIHQTYPRRVKSFQILNGLHLYMSGTECRTVGRLSRLGFCVAYGTVTGFFDELVKSFDEEIIKWRSNWERSNWNSESQLGENNVQSATVDETMEVDGDNPPDILMNDCQPSVSTAEVSVAAANSEMNVTADCVLYTLCFNHMKTSTKVRHDMSSKQHLIQTHALLDRIPLPATAAADHMPSADDILAIPLSSYLPTLEDVEEDFNERKRLVGRVLAKWMHCFSREKKKMALPIVHQYSEQSAVKSKMIPLSTQSLQDKCQVVDAIKFLSKLDEYVPQINSPTERPTKVLIFGDSVSCKLVEDAKKARMNEAVSTERLESFEAAISDWHKCVLLLQHVFNELGVEESAKSVGSLCYLQNLLKQKNAKAPVSVTFDSAFSFMETLTESLIVAAALDHLKMDSIQDDLGEGDSKWVHAMFEEVCDHVTRLGTESPSSVTGDNSQNPQNGQDEYEFCLCKKDTGGIMLECRNSECPYGKWFHLQCIDMSEEDIPKAKRKWYCSTKCHPSKKRARECSTGDQDTTTDSIYEYTRALLWHGLTTLSRMDAIQENDGPRIIRHWKYDIIQFARLNQNKYFKWAVNLLTSVQGGSSKRIAHQLTWCRTVNPTGKPRQNIPVDLQMETFNQGFRDCCMRTSAGHLTDKAVLRNARLAGTQQQLDELYEKWVTESKPARSDNTTFDEEDMTDAVSDLRSANLFSVVPGRSHPGLTNFKFNPFNINVGELQRQLQKGQKDFAGLRKIDMGGNKLS